MSPPPTQPALLRPSRAPAVRWRLVRRAAPALIALVLATAGGPPPPTGRPKVQALTPAGIKTLLGQSRVPLTLVHVWATWCPPCREEFPEVVRFQKAYADRGVHLILVSADAPQTEERVAGYLADQGAPSPSYRIANPDESFINTLSTNWSGAIPASFFFGPDGRLRQWWEGAATYDRYRQTADALLSGPPPATPGAP